MIQEWTRFIRGTEARNQVTFLSDYDMLLTGQLVQGVDVWINTPGDRGGLRDQRHEGARQWRSQPFRTRWLVGGGLSPEVGWALGGRPGT